MHTLYSLQAELSNFYTNLRELIDLRADAVASIMSRPSDDIPYVSQGKNTSSPVERIVIMLVDDGGVKHLQEMVDACIALYQEVPHAWQELLKNVWRDKHHDDLPEELLRKYESLRYPLVEPDTACEAA